MTSYNAQRISGKYYIQYETDSRENYREVEKLIQRQIDGKPPADQWIPCSRELPKDGQHIIATFESNMGARQVTEEYFHQSFLQEPWKMIAWYPFPEPYKGVE